MKILVLAGGLSHERDVSLSSGSLAANALMAGGHSVALVDLYLGIESERDIFLDGDSGKKYSYQVTRQEPDLAKVKEENGGRDALIGPNVIEACMGSDLVFMALHGGIGENGQIQAVFDCYGVKYTGSGYIGSLLAMDKDLAKRIMRQSGVPTADWCLAASEDADAKSLISELGLPLVVKPCCNGSSIGVSMANDRSELEAAISAAGRYESRLLAEKKITGREFSVGILDGRPLPVIEIKPRSGFYNYENKYQAGAAEEICPAELSERSAEDLQELALKTHSALRLGGYSRIDFILDENNGPFCLEANTLPGLTPTSLLPQEAAAAGVCYEDLCDKIAKLAFKAGGQPRAKSRICNEGIVLK
ncbi:MAG: D-alanine--D-alanine ligase [Synergistaceae bacterium]|jgi:D-alanine-D-alanine ligase|nr:D-alanine--D-alanine ligase [Synergistaceae bacterium]